MSIVSISDGSGRIYIASDDAAALREALAKLEKPAKTRGQIVAHEQFGITALDGLGKSLFLNDVYLAELIDAELQRALRMAAKIARDYPNRRKIYSVFEIADDIMAIDLTQEEGQ